MAVPCCMVCRCICRGVFSPPLVQPPGQWPASAFSITLLSHLTVYTDYEHRGESASAGNVHIPLSSTAPSYLSCDLRRLTDTSHKTSTECFATSGCPINKVVIHWRLFVTYLRLTSKFCLNYRQSNIL